MNSLRTGVGNTDYEVVAYGNGGGVLETKRDKRRRDMVDRVGRLLNDTVERRDR